MAVLESDGNFTVLRHTGHARATDPAKAPANGKHIGDREAGI